MSHTGHVNLQTQSCFPPGCSCLYMLQATQNSHLWTQRPPFTIFFFSSFSREFDWDVGIVPVPGDRDAQADSFPHCWEWFWYIRPVNHTLNVTVLQGSRKEHGVLGVKTPGLPHSSLSLFLPMQLNPSCQDPEGSFSLPLQDSAARPVCGVDCQIH